jgi:exopolysaccharide biosynthesis polyprenyl glycosylphosphotransferase
VSSSSRLQAPAPSHESALTRDPTARVEAVRVADGWAYRISKRGLDLVLASAGLVLLLPLLPAIVALVRLDSPGPVLFRQKRVGWRGRPFTCFKFRSMARDAESRKAGLVSQNEATGAAFKIRDDPRITAIGHFLRRSSLDEVPQLLNVIRGEMSIVGPRPQIPSEVAMYAPWHRRRLDVKPGITCLWQVSGRSHIGFDEWMRLDVEYVQRRSLRLDLSILLRTLPAVIARKGAY